MTGSELYTRDVLRLATSLPAYMAMENPDGRAVRRAPLCGSEMLIDVMLDETGCVGQLAIKARACALGQAAAAILALKASALDVATIRAVRENLAEGLQQSSDLGGIWPELAALGYASKYPARYGAILLPFDTLLAAMDGN
jgi:NifU-like protein involved in Fe-S cluster formation